MLNAKPQVKEVLYLHYRIARLPGNRQDPSPFFSSIGECAWSLVAVASFCSVFKAPEAPLGFIPLYVPDLFSLVKLQSRSYYQSLLLRQ